MLFVHLREHVPHQVHGAALLRLGLGQHLARGGDETGMLVAGTPANVAA